MSTSRPRLSANMPPSGYHHRPQQEVGTRRGSDHESAWENVCLEYLEHRDEWIVPHCGVEGRNRLLLLPKLRVPP